MEDDSPIAQPPTGGGPLFDSTYTLLLTFRESKLSKYSSTVKMCFFLSKFNPKKKIAQRLHKTLLSILFDYCERYCSQPPGGRDIKRGHFLKL